MKVMTEDSMRKRLLASTDIQVVEPSRFERDQWYKTVNSINGHVYFTSSYGCTCPSAPRYGINTPCKHMIAVRDYLMDKTGTTSF